MPCHSERSEESENTTSAFQILRDAQDDKMIGDIHYAIPFYILKEIYIILTTGFCGTKDSM